MSDELAVLFHESSAAAGHRAPLYRRLGAAIADDPSTSRLLLHAPPDQRLPVLLYACVHWLLIREPDHELRRWYPNLAAAHPLGRADDGDPWPIFRRFCLDHEDRLAELLATRTTQTNEIGRCALFLPALGRLSSERGPLALLDVGTSAGLNLLLDRYHYRYVDDTTGSSTMVTPVGSGPDRGGPGRGRPGRGRPDEVRPVELTCGTRGPVPVPRGLPPIVDRIGLDRDPVDLAVAADADWLRACVWPDQADRFERLDAALTMAAADPPVIVAGDAVADLVATADRLDPAAHLVVMSSWVLNYLGPSSRRDYLESLDELGSRRDTSWLAVESPAVTEELPWPDDTTDRHLTHVLQVDWREGRRVVTRHATAHPHGYWMHWSARTG